MKKAKVSKTAVNEIELSLITQQVLNGQIKKMPQKVTLDLRQASAADYEALLDLVRYRAFGHQVMKAQPPVAPLQQVRTLIHSGSFGEARRISESLDEADVEVRIEKARAICFLGHFSEVLPILAPILADASVRSNHRGVAHQIAGHAHLELGQLVQAELALESARQLANSAGNSLGSISAYLFLSRLQMFEGKWEKAEVSLEKAATFTLQQGSFRWLLAYYRHLSQFHYFTSSLRSISEAHAAVLLARTLKDKVFEYRGVLEIVLMARKFGLVIDLGDLREIINQYAETSESDLKQWVAAILHEAEPHSYTAKRFIEEGRSVQAGLIVDLVPQLHREIAWFYDRESGLVVDLESGDFSKISADGPLGKIIAALNDSGKGMSTSDLFERVWKIRWSADKHQNVLDVNLHRLSKVSKAIVILREEHLLKLSRKGLVF